MFIIFRVSLLPQLCWTQVLYHPIHHHCNHPAFSSSSLIYCILPVYKQPNLSSPVYPNSRIHNSWRLLASHSPTFHSNQYYRQTYRKIPHPLTHRLLQLPLRFKLLLHLFRYLHCYIQWCGSGTTYILVRGSGSRGIKWRESRV